MDLDDLLGPNPTVIDLKSIDRWGAIDELLGHLASSKKIEAEQRAVVADAVKRRENAMSTGIGFEIAIPHASTDLVSEVVVAIGRSRDGIDFRAVDGKTVKLVVLFLVPTGQFQKHVNTLANIAKLLHRRFL